MLDYFIQANNIDFGKVHSLQHIKVTIICNHKSCITCYSAIYKLVVIRVSFDKVETIIRRYKQCVRIIRNYAKGSLCKLRARVTFQYLSIFAKDFRRYAHNIPSVEE